MTEDRALKRAIRQRMEETGEKYTEARRALVGAAPAWVPPSASEPFWEDKRKLYEEIAAREGEVVAQARMFDLLHWLQLMFSLPPAPAPPNVIGGPTAPGGWPLPMRTGVECSAAAVEASTPLAEAGFGRQIERNREIVERTLALIDGTAGRPKQAREGRARVRPDGPPTARPPLRTCRTLPAGGPDGWGRSSELEHEPSHSSRDHALRHPFAGNRIRAAAEGMGDPTVTELIDAWLDDLQRNYRELEEGIPAAWCEHGQLDFEAVIEELDDDDDPDPGGGWSTGLPSPVRVRVDKRIRGDAGAREAVATHILVVEDDWTSVSDGIAAFPHERWHIRGHRLADGTIMPCLGSYRIAIAEVATAS